MQASCPQHSTMTVAKMDRGILGRPTEAC
uniref:Uncharacterized protein n=1 Tax=Anguilla anguilla TaxID=7936 RepID=A0A0E9TI96_ANGAN